MVNEKQVIDTIVAGLSVLFGLLIFYFSANGYKYVTGDCANNLLRNSLTTILALSAGIVTVGLSYGACMISSNNCYSGVVRSTDTASVYFTISAVIALGVIIAASTIIAQVKSSGAECGGAKLKQDAVIILVLSIMVFIASVIGVTVSTTVIFGKGGSNMPSEPSGLIGLGS